MKILVVGSSNTDMVVKTSRIPKPGETIIGGSFFMNQGGKGANQAVAAARLGAKVLFICKTGRDLFGKQALQAYEKEGIDTSFVFSSKTAPTGVAAIYVDKKGENCIVVAPGANFELLPNDIDVATEAIKACDIILMQLEIPMETVEYVAALGKQYNKKVILNPAPARELPQKLMESVYLITPNETEAEIITGIQITDENAMQQAAKKMNSMGIENVIITLGAQGAYVYSPTFAGIVPANKVKAVDTTAAGDIFNGALAVALSENVALEQAVRFASKASAISVTREGAQPSAPYRKEVDNF